MVLNSAKYEADVLRILVKLSKDNVENLKAVILIGFLDRTKMLIKFLFMATLILSVSQSQL